ncbi:MAG TPA: PadR family transcriptional regulator [Opitutaceae bacterium]|jgi:transcriptional regulator|nr:PadR family transcriptional regulator [Opitutaceae bacterium]
MLTANMSRSRTDVLQGTLDLLVLKTLEAMGPMHGFGIARRIEQLAQNALALNQGTLYPALLRLEQKGLIASEWGVSANRRRARFYSLTRRGRAQLAEEIRDWQRASDVVNAVVAATRPSGA